MVNRKPRSCIILKINRSSKLQPQCQYGSHGNNLFSYLLLLLLSLHHFTQSTRRSWLSLVADNIEVLRQIDDSQSPISTPPLDDKEYLNLINQMEGWDKHARSLVDSCKHQRTHAYNCTVLLMSMIKTQNILAHNEKNLRIETIMETNMLFLIAYHGPKELKGIFLNPLWRFSNPRTGR